MRERRCGRRLVGGRKLELRLVPYFFFSWGRGRAAGEGFGRGDPCLVFWMVVLVDEGVQTDGRAGLV